MTRYQHLAALLGQRIEQGLYRSGERLPSVRALSSEHGVSISTVQQAYHLLETRQLIIPQPRSGYFVAPRKATPPIPALTRPAQRPVEITQWESVLELFNACLDNSAFNFGSGTPDVSQSSIKPLWKFMSRFCQRQDERVLNYGNMYGVRELREQVARLALDSGCQLTRDDIVITTGCQEALFVAVRAICESGDIVAVESPTFPGTLQLLRGLGIKVIEIPTCAIEGMSLDALKLALEQWPIKAVLLVPTCNNPLGFCMSDAYKQALITLAQQFDVAIIEDDAYGELAYDYPRPRTVKSFDDDGRVLLCSSFSKTIAPGLRVGWIAPGRYLERVLHMKYVCTGYTVTHTQLTVAEFIGQGWYQPHLRRMRMQYKANLDVFTCQVREYFPCEICVSRPQGGFLMWIELPEQFDSLRLNRDVRKAGIQIAAGSLFSASGKYRNCMRLNYSLPFTQETSQGLRIVGETVAKMLAERDDGKCRAESPVEPGRNPIP
ncbi:PLP-dependent aminotransferase family protein [Brenneria rubrifaciens]|uniref:PLP-dependent aminotransferase family protein n=1 Tax=Brenneria rubrifaciens TaxID=55213 RepID=A0A4P8QS30_9GAMM|nr:PLP-dependent aminotransferase family protein [Brenneria rubrifaciens]QCR09952.1 PLP-dependent aminotransferase family protein [Brenneria rubrifaciens]